MSSVGKCKFVATKSHVSRFKIEVNPVNHKNIGDVVRPPANIKDRKSILTKHYIEDISPVSKYEIKISVKQIINNKAR